LLPGLHRAEGKEKYEEHEKADAAVQAKDLMPSRGALRLIIRGARERFLQKGLRESQHEIDPVEQGVKRKLHEVFRLSLPEPVAVDEGNVQVEEAVEEIGETLQLFPALCVHLPPHDLERGHGEWQKQQYHHEREAGRNQLIAL
jgi:hypothetical protein